jgi:succinate dehydrogenase / fumarate reductase cytochrome b subunit
MIEASPGGRPRPLSPHLLQWRWHITMAASILNRATGVALYAGWLILAGWALSLASGAQAYSAFCDVLASFPGRIVLFGVAFSLFFHMAAGLRHLFWDFGKGFQPRRADASAIAALVFALIASVAVFVLASLPSGSQQ